MCIRLRTRCMHLHLVSFFGTIIKEHCYALLDFLGLARPQGSCPPRLLPATHLLRRSTCVGKIFSISWAQIELFEELNLLPRSSREKKIRRWRGHHCNHVVQLEIIICHICPIVVETACIIIHHKRKASHGSRSIFLFFFFLLFCAVGSTLLFSIR